MMKLDRRNMRNQEFCLIPLLIFFIGFSHGLSQNQLTSDKKNDWRDLSSVEDLWQFYPEKLRNIFASLDLSNPELSDVKTALNTADTIAAGKALIEYYKNKKSWLREETGGFSNQEERQKAMALLSGDKVSLRDFTVEIPKNNDGGWQWDFTGPANDDEFGYELNRHQYFLLLLKGWNETGDEKFAQKFDTIVRDWTLHNPMPGKDHLMWEVHRTTTGELDWRDIEEVVWRDLEAGIRLGESWLPAFFGFQQANSFSTAGRLLMLDSILIQADYLRDYHKNNHNWTTMEMNGLGLAGLVFPEFKKAEEWVDYALATMEKEINKQVYPDGTQTEVSTLTQQVALERFELLAENFQKAGRDVPQRYLSRIEDMYNYLAYSMRPDGHQPLNNDSDRDNLQPLVLNAAEKFDRDDWTYIATNGREGKQPVGLASKVFPWAGLHFMRDGWGVNSQWAIFDTGPFGTGHQHSDMLHLSIHAHGRDLLVDSGRYTHENYFSFNPVNWRGFFRSSFSHNVILVDGKGQAPGPLRAEKPLEEEIDCINTNSFDYARGTFSYGFADGTDSGFSKENVTKADHTRAVFYVKGKYWVVVDHVEADTTHKIEVLWNLAPNVSAVVEGNQIVSNDSGTGNLRIVPVGDLPWNINIIKGQTEPIIRGWYSEAYGTKTPNRTAVYSAHIEGDQVFAWIIVPAFGRIPEVVHAELPDKKTVKLNVQIEGEELMLITVPLTSNSRPEIEF